MDRVLFTDYVKINDEIHFFDGGNRLPGKINVDSGIVTYINNLEGYDIEKDSLCRTLYKNSKMYVLLNAGNAILVYDIEKKSCSYIDIFCGKEQWDNFACFLEYGEKLFVFPRYKKEILCIDTNENSTEIFSYVGFMPFCGIKVQEKVWLFSQNGSQAMVFELVTYECKLYDLEMCMEGVVACTHIQNQIFILNKYGLIYVLDINDGKMRKITVAENEHDVKYTVGRILAVGEKLIVFPTFDDRIKYVNLRNETVEIYSDYPDDFSYCADIRWSKYYGITEDEDYYYMLRMSNYILKIKKNTGKFYWVKIVKPTQFEKMDALYSYGKQEFFEKHYKKENIIELVRATEKKDRIINELKGSTIWESVKR